MPKGLIIGAGVAGAAAAQHLTARGWAVALLDKAGRAGGRCATWRASNGAWADHGAQYFTARTADFRGLVDAELAAARLCHWQPTTCVAERRGGAWQVEASPDGRERLIGRSGLDAWAAAQAAASGATLYLDATVARVAAHDDGWRAELGSGGVYRGFDALILACPPGAARALLADDAPRAVAPNGYHMSPTHALVVRAPAVAGCDAAFVRGSPLGWIANNASKPGQPRAAHRLWTLHATSDWSAAHFDDPRATVIDTMAATFAAITGLDRAAIEPLHLCRWRHARPAPDAPTPTEPYLHDPGTGVAIAGDWLAGGRMEGAWLSGRAAAQALLTR